MALKLIVTFPIKATILDNVSGPGQFEVEEEDEVDGNDEEMKQYNKEDEGKSTVAESSEFVEPVPTAAAEKSEVPKSSEKRRARGKSGKGGRRRALHDRRGEKPRETYIQLIGMAIEAQESKRATLTEIVGDFLMSQLMGLESIDDFLWLSGEKLGSRGFKSHWVASIFI